MNDPDQTRRTASARCNGHCARCPRAAACPARQAAKGAPILLSGVSAGGSSRNADGVGFAVDVGSTTLAAGVYDLRTGALLARAGCAKKAEMIITDTSRTAVRNRVPDI